MQSRVVQQPEATEQLLCGLTVRPLRFGFIVNRTIGPDVFEQINQYNTSLWGGQFNIFVPTDGKSVRSDWWRQLVFHDPDVIFLVGQVDGELASELYMQIQPMQIWQWDKASLDNLTGQSSKTEPVLMDVILENLYAEQGNLGPRKSRIRYPLVRNSLFAPYLHLICGMWLPASHYQEYAERNLGALEMEINPKNLKAYLDILDELEKWIMPLDLTARNLSTSYPGFGLGGYSLVLSTGMLDELLIYHALRWSHRNSSGKPTTAIVPISAITSDADYHLLAQWFGQKVGGNTFDIISYGVDLNTLIGFRDKLKAFLPPRGNPLNAREGWVINIERCNINASTPDVTHAKRKQLVNVSGNRYSFEYSKPSFLEKDADHGYKSKHWICGVELSPGFGNKRAFAPSMFPDLNFILSNWPNRGYLYGVGTFIRVARGEIALSCTMEGDIARIELPSNKKVIETACENSGYQIGSGNSIYYQGMITLLGNLQDAAFLHNPNILKLFSNPLLIQENALTVIEMYKHLRIPQDDKSDFLNWIQILAGKQILLRGYNLQCPVCGLTAWYELANVHEFMICEGCRSNFQIPVYRDFAYRLNRLFAVRQNQGSVTVLLTLLLLHETAIKGLLWQADTVLQKVVR